LLFFTLLQRLAPEVYSSQLKFNDFIIKHIWNFVSMSIYCRMKPLVAIISCFNIISNIMIECKACISYSSSCFDYFDFFFIILSWWTPICSIITFPSFDFTILHHASWQTTLGLTAIVLFCAYYISIEILYFSIYSLP